MRALVPGRKQQVFSLQCIQALYHHCNMGIWVGTGGGQNTSALGDEQVYKPLLKSHDSIFDSDLMSSSNNKML
jgi:hypothetical protein